MVPLTRFQSFGEDTASFPLWSYLPLVSVGLVFLLSMLQCACCGGNNKEQKDIPEKKEEKLESASKKGKSATDKKSKGKRDDDETSLIVNAEPLSPAATTPEVDLDDLDIGHTSHHSMRTTDAGSMPLTGGKKKTIGPSALSSSKKP